MKRAVFAILVVLCGTAQAQERTFNLTVTEPQLNYIGKALGKQPYEDVRAIIDSIQTQVNAQLAREPERPKAATPKEDPKP